MEKYPDYHNRLKNESGMIAILSLVGVSTIVLAVISTMALISINDLKIARNGGAVGQVFYAAESGLNEGLYRLSRNPVPGSYAMVIDDIEVRIEIRSDPMDNFRRIVESVATDATGKIRKLQIMADTNAYAGGFDFSLQCGDGGVVLSNNSRVVGDIYSNGDITARTSGGNPDVIDIEGKVWAANGGRIDSVHIHEDAHARNIINTHVDRNAYYQTISGSTVGGSAYAESSDPEPIEPAVAGSDAERWKAGITAFGSPVSYANSEASACHRPGFYCVLEDQALGNQKIDADFYVGNQAALTLTGNLWITGRVMLDNNGTIRIDPSLGDFSVVILSDGVVDISPNYQINGSGSPRSYVMILSLSANNDPAGVPAVYASNNSESTVYMAINGILKVKNNGFLNAGSAKTIFLEPNSEVVFDSNISNFAIPGNGEYGVDVLTDTWKEL